MKMAIHNMSEQPFLFEVTPSGDRHLNPALRDENGNP
jgi:hypothetical protein